MTAPAGLADKLDATLLRMANECSVDMTLWDKHSNLCLQAIAALRAPSPSEPWPLPTTRADLDAILEVTRHAAYHEGWRARGESAAEPTEAAITRDVTTGADKIITMLRAREAETIAAIGHLMTKTEKPLEGIAADLIEQILAAVVPAEPTEAMVECVALVVYRSDHWSNYASLDDARHLVRKALEGGQ